MPTRTNSKRKVNRARQVHHEPKAVISVKRPRRVKTIRDYAHEITMAGLHDLIAQLIDEEKHDTSTR